MLTFKDFINSDIYEEFISEKMMKLNINMNKRDIHKHISSKGWKIARQSGDHDIYQHPDCAHNITVPRHAGNLAPGTVRDILKKAA